MTDNLVTKQDINNMREAYRAKVFRMMFRIAMMFAVPAGLAVWLGGMLDSKFSTDGNMWRLILLAVAFVLSWVMVARLYIQLNKESKSIEEKASVVAKAMVDKKIVKEK